MRLGWRREDPVHPPISPFFYRAFFLSYRGGGYKEGVSSLLHTSCFWTFFFFFYLCGKCAHMCVKKTVSIHRRISETVRNSRKDERNQQRKKKRILKSTDWNKALFEKTWGKKRRLRRHFKTGSTCYIMQRPGERVSRNTGPNKRSWTIFDLSLCTKFQLLCIVQPSCSPLGTF